MFVPSTSFVLSAIEPMTPARKRVDNILPLQNETPESTASSSNTGSNSVRKRIRGKSSPAASWSAHCIIDKQQLFFSDPMTKSFRRLKQQDKRKWNKRLGLRLHRLARVAKTGDSVSLQDGSTWTFASEDEFSRRSIEFRKAVYSAMAGSVDEHPMMRGASMQAWLNLHRTAQVCTTDAVRTVKGQTALLTWQGPWGLLPEIASGGPRDTGGISVLCKKLESTPAAVSLFRNMEVLEAAVTACSALCDGS
jgi:hypothetical protein